MPYIDALNLFNAIIIIGVSLPTIYMAARIRLHPVRTLFILLSSFLFLHGLYHLSAFLGASLENDLVNFVGDTVLEPVSYILLLAFALYFWRRGG